MIYGLDDDPSPRGFLPSGSLDGATWSQTPAANRPSVSVPTSITPGQRRRHRRNVIICLAIRAGLSERYVAEAMGLARSRIAEIVAAYAGVYPSREGPA